MDAAFDVTDIDGQTMMLIVGSNEQMSDLLANLGELYGEVKDAQTIMVVE